MDFISEEFETFKSSVNRMRWFVITSVLISVLILVHIYLEQFGFQDHQLKVHFGNNLEKYIDQSQACRKALAEHKQYEKDHFPTKFPEESCNEQIIPKELLNKILEVKDRDDLIEKYSEEQLRIEMAQNTINDLKHQIRRIPMLGIEVPANDFIIVMSIMSLVFVTGLWINFRGVLFSLKALAQHNEQKLIELARINTVFLTHLETSRGQILAQAVRILGIWLPSMSLVISLVGYIDPINNMLDEGVHNFGSKPYIVSNLCMAIIIILMHFWVAYECMLVMKEIGVIFQKKES